MRFSWGVAYRGGACFWPDGRTGRPYFSATLFNNITVRSPLYGRGGGGPLTANAHEFIMAAGRLSKTYGVRGCAE